MLWLSKFTYLEKGTACSSTELILIDLYSSRVSLSNKLLICACMKFNTILTENRVFYSTVEAIFVCCANLVNLSDCHGFMQVMVDPRFGFTIFITHQQLNT